MLLQVTSLLLFLYLDWTTNQSIPFGYLLHLLVQGHQGPILYFLELLSSHHQCWRARWQWTRSLQSKSIWRNRRQEVRRSHIGFMYRHSRRPSQTCSWNLPPSLTKLSSGKKQNFRSEEYSFQVQNCHDFQSTHVRLNEFRSTHVSLRPRTLYVTDYKPNMYIWTKTHQTQAIAFNKHNTTLVVLRLSPCLECSLCSFGNFPSVRSLKAFKLQTPGKFPKEHRLHNTTLHASL